MSKPLHYEQNFEGQQPAAEPTFHIEENPHVLGSAAVDAAEMEKFTSFVELTDEVPNLPAKGRHSAVRGRHTHEAARTRKRETARGIGQRAIEERRDQEVGKVWQRLAELDPNESANAEAYFEHHMPEDLRDAKEAAQPEESWRTWFVVHASGDQLLRYFKWHGELVEEQSGENSGLIRSARKEFAGDTMRGVEEQWLHPAAEMVAASIRDKKVVVGDYFDTLMQGRAGYNDRSSDLFVLAQGTGETRLQRRDTFTRAVKNGLFHHEAGHDFPGFASEIWNEAGTELATQMMLKGYRPNVYEYLYGPDANLASIRYAARLQVLDTSLTRGGLHIPAEFVTRAHSSPIDSPDRVDLPHFLDESWDTHDFLGQVSSAEQEFTQAYKDSGLPWNTAQSLSAQAVNGLLVNNPDRILARR